MKTLTLSLTLFLCFAALSFAAPAFIATKGPDGVQRVEIIGGSYFFKPSRIIVKTGTPVELKIKKERGITPHNFVLESAGEGGKDIGVSLKSTEARVVRFTPHTPGTFKFYCDKKLLFFKSHRKKGMEGTLEVID